MKMMTGYKVFDVEGDWYFRPLGALGAFWHGPFESEQLAHEAALRWMQHE